MNIYISNRTPIGNYVYYYIRSKNSDYGKIGTPYYVGKGVGRRAWHKGHNVNIPSNEHIVIIADNLTHEQAILIEILHIKLWGRIDMGTGILRNRTAGGEGTTGFKHTPEEVKKIGIRSKTRVRTVKEKIKISNALRTRIISDDTRKKMSMAQTGRKHSIQSRKKMSLLRLGVPLSPHHRESLKKRVKTPEQIQKHKNAMTGRKITDEHKRKISNSMIGKKFTDEHKNNMSKARTGQALDNLKKFLANMPPEQMQARIEKMKNCDQDAKNLSIRKSKSSKFLLIKPDGDTVEFYSYDDVESITGYNYQHIKWRLKKFNGLLHNGNKVIPLMLNHHVKTLLEKIIVGHTNVRSFFMYCS